MMTSLHRTQHAAPGLWILLVASLALPGCSPHGADERAEQDGLLRSRAALVSEAHARQQEALQNQAQLIAEVDALRLTLNLGMKEQLSSLGIEHVGSQPLDLFFFTGETGSVFSSVLGGPRAGVTLAQFPLVARALSGERATATVAVDSRLFFGRDPTQAPPTTLVVMTACPIHFRNVVIGSVVLGIRLNGNADYLQLLLSGSEFDLVLLHEDASVSTTLPANTPVTEPEATDGDGSGPRLVLTTVSGIPRTAVEVELPGPNGDSVASLLVLARRMH